MKILKQYHQGDVLFLKLSELPEIKGQKPLELPPNFVVHHGEGLGHFHQIQNVSINDLQVFDMGERDSNKTMALVVTNPVEVVHEEHAPLELDPGFWIAKTQRETTRGLVRPVID